ncbi:MAG: ADP-ribosylation factor-like protein [Promethearchaeota archaeon]
MALQENLSKIRDFFKSNVSINDIEALLQFPPDTLVGIDQISAEKLAQQEINTIEDLAKINENNPPEIRGIPPIILVKWIKIAKLLQKNVSEQVKLQKKLLMIGLDNSGKSSILAVAQDKFSIVKDLLPTKGVKRERLDFFGYPIISWDLGGQIQYRENYYFNKPELFFTEVDLILYVVDIQDENRFEESVNYFEEVNKILKELGETPPMVIVLHKSDQDLRKTLRWQKNVATVKKEFDPIIEKYEIDADYIDTTIFQKETILQMFSIALKKISETSEIIEHILLDFSLSVQGRGACLISLDGLIFGSYTKDKVDEKLLHNTALLLQTLTNFHKTIGLKQEHVLSLEFHRNGFTIRGEKLFEYSELEIPVFLWTLSEQPELVIEKIKYFRDQLLPLINLFL